MKIHLVGIFCDSFGLFFCVEKAFANKSEAITYAKEHGEYVPYMEGWGDPCKAEGKFSVQTVELK